MERVQIESRATVVHLLWLMCSQCGDLYTYPLPVCLTLCLSFYLSVYLPIILSVYLSVLYASTLLINILEYCRSQVFSILCPLSSFYSYSFCILKHFPRKLTIASHHTDTDTIYCCDASACLPVCAGRVQSARATTAATAPPAPPPNMSVSEQLLAASLQQHQTTQKQTTLLLPPHAALTSLDEEEEGEGGGEEWWQPDMIILF